MFSTTAFSAVDMKQSSFKWKGTKVTGMHEGNISIKSADLKMKDDGRINTGKIVMDMNTITVTDISGDMAKKFLQHVTTEDFFMVKKYPTATLEIQRDTGKTLEGILTVKDVPQRVIVPYTKSGKTYSGTLKFDRTKHGIKYGSGSFFKGLGDKMIHDEVTLDFKVVMK